MGKKDVPIMKVISVQNSIMHGICHENEISTQTEALHALTSGFDVGITIFEASRGPFDGFTLDSARNVYSYFKDEANRYKNKNKEIAIWYYSWAEAIEQLFIKKLV